MRQTVFNFHACCRVQERTTRFEDTQCICVEIPIAIAENDESEVELND